MWVPLAIFLTITLLLSGYSVNKFIRLANQPPYLSIILIVSLFLPLSIIFILPIDLISSISNDSSGGIFTLNNSLILLIWRINYWITFLLTWIILPFLQYWFDSGYFKNNLRFKDSVFKLIKFQLLMILFGIVGFIYLAINHKEYLNFTHLKSLIITISHIYALAMALFLLSHGLTHIPRLIWDNSTNYELLLNKTYLNLPILDEKLHDTQFELKECCSKVKSIERLNDMIPLEHRDNVIELVNQIPEEFLNQYLIIETVAVEDVNTKALTLLNKQMHRLKWKYNHSKINLQSNIDKAVRLEDLVNSKLLGELHFRLSIHSSWFLKNPKMNYIYNQFINPFLGKLMAIGLVLLSIIIVESEVLHNSVISILRVLSTKFLQDDVKILIISIIMLTYICLSSLFSLSQIKIFNIYHVESNQSSDPVSLIFFISYAARLTIPLCYNYLMMLDGKLIENSSFQKFLGDSIKLIPLGEFLNSLLPRLIIIPIILTFFRVGERLKRWFTGNFLVDYLFDEFDFEDENDNSLEGGQQDMENNREVFLIQEAKKIIEKNLKRNVNLVNSSNSFRGFNLSRQLPTTFDNLRTVPTLGEKISRVFNRMLSRFTRGGSNGHDNYENLRPYNLQSGGDSRGNSMDSGFSLSTQTNSFESDNHLIRDEELMLIDDDDDEEERLVL